MRLIQAYVDHDNTVSHSAIGCVTPLDMLAGRQAEIHAARNRKLKKAHCQRQLRRTAASMLAHSSNAATITLQVEQITSRDGTKARMRVGSLAAHAITDVLDNLEKEARRSCLRDGGPTSRRETTK
jgi:hypothetical protein